jgi:hypothetical protein
MNDARRMIVAAAGVLVLLGGVSHNFSVSGSLGFVNCEL